MSPIIGTLTSGSSFGRRGGGAGLTVTGGSVGLVNGFIVHSFTGDQNFTVQGGSLTGVEILLIAGGGGGGTRNAGVNNGGTDGGAGGGGGGFVQVSGQTISAGTYVVDIGGGGGGGKGSQSPGVVGQDTTFFGLTAKGGGYGGCGPGNNPGGPGGSGGGAGGGGGSPGSGGPGIQSSQPGLSGSNGFGSNGSPNPNVAPYTGSGGGGAGGGGTVGGNGNEGWGGNGKETTISGSSFYYSSGGGGGGGGPSTTNGGNAGGPSGTLYSGEAGHGGKSPRNQPSTNGIDCGANTGHGGGGGCGQAPGHSGTGGAGGNGGPGIVIVRYPYIANNIAKNFKDGSSSANAAGSPLEISLALGSTPSTGVYWFRNPGYNSNTPFQALADWSVWSQGVIIFCGTNCSGSGNSENRSWSEFGTQATSASGTPGFRNNFYLPSANILSSWTGDSNRKFMMGQTAQDGATINASSNKRWHIMDLTPGEGKLLFDGDPGVGEYKGRVSASSSGTTNSFWWSSSHGNSIWQMTTNRDSVNSELWMETRTGGGDTNHTAVCWGNNNGQYFVANNPFSTRWMFMGFSPNNFAI